MPSNIINQEKLLGSIDRILKKRSIAARCSDLQPMTGPLGVVLGMQRDSINDKLILKRKEVTPDSEIIKTEFTQESIQDLSNIYGEDIYDVIGHYLVDDLTYKIDSKFTTMLKTRGETKGTLTFDGSTYNNSLRAVGEAIAIKIAKGLSDLPISDNRSSGGFAVVSSDVAAIMGIALDLENSEEDDDGSPSYMGTIAGVEYFIDYTHDNTSTDAVLFGIKGNGISKGSAIFCPYKREWMFTINSETGEKVYFLNDRTGMTINPLDDIYYSEGVTPSAFVGKFDVDVSGLAVFQ